MKALAAILLLCWVATTGAALHIVATPCPTEDSTLCYWDGDTRGNKTGISFVSLTETLKVRTA